jgi:hypothetical protein
VPITIKTEFVLNVLRPTILSIKLVFIQAWGLMPFALNMLILTVFNAKLEVFFQTIVAK